MITGETTGGKQDEKAIDGGITQAVTVDLISRDREGKIIEHIRINPDGSQELVE